MKKPHLTLYGQVLMWFFLNLALVAAVFFVVLRFQFNVGVWSLFSGQVNERIEAMGELMAGELRTAAETDWDSILARHGEAYGVTFSLTSPDGGRHFAGPKQELPAELQTFLEENFPRPEGRNGDRRGVPPRDEFNDPNDRIRRLPRPRGRDAEDGFNEPDDGIRPLPRGIGREGGRPFNDPDDGVRPRPGRPRQEGEEFFDGEDDGPNDRRDGEEGSPGRGRGKGPPRVVFYGKDQETSRYWVAMTVGLGGKEFRHPPDGVILASADSLGGNDVFFDWRPWAWSLVGVLIVSALIWFPFVHRMSRRLRTLTSAAESISEGDFDVEVASKRTDELGRLSRAVQRMAMRLDDYVSGQKRFLGDIAHELCSPLVRARMSLGILEQELSEEESSKLEAVNEEMTELSQLVNELLDFSKASLKPEALPRREVDVVGLVDHVVRREAAGAVVALQVSPGLTFESNPDLLQRALANIVRNAVRYSGEQGGIEVRAGEREGDVVIEVVDRGPGVPGDWLNRIFEPFSRPEKARTREGGGAGLGLAIAKACTEALGGAIRGRNRTGGGFAVELRFPPSR